MKLSEQEQAVLTHLMAAFNDFCELPQQHPSDAKEFAEHIHVLQRHVMARLTRRIHPEIFRRDGGT